MFSLLARKYTEYKFKRNDLRIIQQIPAQSFASFLDEHRQKGWEMTDSYQAFNQEADNWHCKLRKGTSVLECHWRQSQNGSVTGPARIINGLAKGLDMPAYTSPRD